MRDMRSPKLRYGVRLSIRCGHWMTKALLKGLGQVVNLANTFGSTYSSGLLIFGGGDSRGIQEKELIDHLIKKGLAI